MSRNCQQAIDCHFEVLLAVVRTLCGSERWTKFWSLKTIWQCSGRCGGPLNPPASRCLSPPMERLPWETFRATMPRIVILDLRLPGKSGQDICREIKQEFSSVPILVLSAASDVLDKVLLLEIGADDYVTKPFSPRELLARVQAALRRAARTDVGEVATFDGIAVDFTKMEVMRDGQPALLTAQEFKTLKLLVQNAERVISRDELLN